MNIEKQTITLTQPLSLADDNKITEIEIIPPANSNVMRGLFFAFILAENEEQCPKLLQRVTEPSLSPAMIEKMSLKDSGALFKAVKKLFGDEFDEIDFSDDGRVTVESGTFCISEPTVKMLINQKIGRKEIELLSYNAVSKLLPEISNPVISKKDFFDMPLPDSAMIALKVASFFQ
jgi:hypothetical protein